MSNSSASYPPGPGISYLPRIIHTIPHSIPHLPHLILDCSLALVQDQKEVPMLCVHTDGL
jgi:hypothetical protein